MTKSRMSLAALLLGATIAGAAFAQDAAPPNPTGKASVTIKDAANKDAGTKPAAAPATGGAGTTKTGVNRDPFVEASRSMAAPKKGSNVVVTAGPKKSVTKDKKVEVKVTIAPPPVTVHGIVESAHGNMAILVGPSQTWIVKSGDKLGDYHVTKIGKKTVAFSYEDKTFKLPLQNDPLSGVSKKGGKKK
jgi:hypothetical protein